MVLSADTVNLDDTGLRVKHEKTKGGVIKAKIWVFIGRKYAPDGDVRKTQEFSFFLYTPTWEAKYPEEFLMGASVTLQGDAYRGYERIASEHAGDGLGKLLAGCLMHARRPFHQAFECDDPLASFFIERIQAIYKIERQAKDRALTIPQRLQLRREHALPIFEQIKQADKLIVPFTQDGRLDIDNASAEQKLRHIASGRSAWLMAGSPAGAVKHADLLSLVVTAQAAGVEPGQYLADILPLISDWPHRKLDELLPHNWRNRAQSFGQKDRTRVALHSFSILFQLWTPVEMP